MRTSNTESGNMRINVKNGKTEILLDVAERRCLVKALDVAKGLIQHGSEGVAKSAVTTELGLNELLASFPESTDKPAAK